MAEYEVEVLGVVLVGVFQYLRCTRRKEPFITYFTVHYLFINHFYSIIFPIVTPADSHDPK
jgi:hypothetical protein